MLGVLGQEVIHIIADAVTKRVTDFPDAVESGDQAVLAVVWADLRACSNMRTSASKNPSS
jgi:hypothetical protein